MESSILNKAKSRMGAQVATQRGALMVLVLVILLVVSLLGMSTVDTSGLEMRMASNSRDQQAAFEAAEYTLSFVENQISGTGFSSQSLSNQSCGSICFESTCTGGYCFNGTEPNSSENCRLNAPATEPYEDAALWQNGSGRHQTLTVSGMTVRYIIEFRCYTALDPTVAMSDTNFSQVYRITAFATGPAGRGRVMLRSTMKML